MLFRSQRTRSRTLGPAAPSPRCRFKRPLCHVTGRGPHPRARNRKPQAGPFSPGAGRPSPNAPRGEGAPVAPSLPTSARVPGSESLPRAGKLCSLPWRQGALRNLRRKQLGARCPRAGAQATDIRTLVPPGAWGQNRDERPEEKGNSPLGTPGKRWPTLGRASIISIFILQVWGSPGEGAQWIFIANAPELS